MVEDVGLVSLAFAGVQSGAPTRSGFGGLFRFSVGWSCGREVGFGGLRGFIKARSGRREGGFVDVTCAGVEFSARLVTFWGGDNFSFWPVVSISCLIAFFAGDDSSFVLFRLFSFISTSSMVCSTSVFSVFVFGVPTRSSSSSISTAKELLRDGVDTF